MTGAHATGDGTAGDRSEGRAGVQPTRRPVRQQTPVAALMQLWASFMALEIVVPRL